MATSEAHRAKRRAGKLSRRRRRKARSSTDTLHQMYDRGERIVFAQQALRKLYEGQPKLTLRRRPLRAGESA